MKEKNIVIVVAVVAAIIVSVKIVVAVVAAIIFSVKDLPLWSTFITTAVAAASFVGGWFGKKWYDHHVK